MTKNTLRVRPALALLSMLAAPVVVDAQPSARLLAGLAGDLASCAQAARAAAGSAAIDDEAVPACLLRVRAADLVLTAAQRDLETRLRDKGLSAETLARQARVATLYRAELDDFYTRADAVIRARDAGDVTAFRAAADALARHLASRVTPPDRRVLAEAVSNRQLNLPRVPAPGGPTVQPAYLKTDVEPPTDGDLGAGARTPRAIVEQAVALAQDPIAIFEFVQNEIDTELYQGVLEGAEGTLRQKRGNDADQAALLVALMRASGIPARFVRGVISLTDAQAIAWTGVSTGRLASDVFTRAGIPFDPVIQGGGIGAFRIEHTWAEVFVSYGNYRGVPLDEAGRAWVPLDPSWKTRTFAAGEPLPAGAGFTADAIAADYLAAPEPPPIAEFYRTRITDALGAQEPPLTLDAVLGTLTRQTVRRGLLPSTLPYQVSTVLYEGATLPDGLQHRLRFVASGDGGDAFDVVLPASEVAGRRVTLSYVPATVEDQITAHAFLGLDNTPAYLLRVRPVLKVGGVVRGAGTMAIPMGALHDFRVEIQAPGTSIPILNTVVAGGYFALAFGLREISLAIADAPSPADTEHPAAETLFQRAADYLTRWTAAERLLGGALRVLPVHPTLSMAIVGNEYRRTVLFGQPQSLEWRGVFVDADVRVTEPIPIVGGDTVRKEFMQLSGLAGSALEAEVLHDLFQVDAVSATRIIQLAQAAGQPIERITRANLAAALPLLATSDEVKAHVRDAVNQGLEVTIPRSDLVRHVWSGTGYIVLNPATGEGGYFISGGLSGGMTTEDPDEWVLQQYVDELGNPYQPEPNADSTAAFTITKLAITDKQEGTVGEPLERDLAVWVRDAEGRPVAGADVTFTTVAGGATFEGDSDEVTVQTNSLGVAKARPRLGEKTGESPFYVQGEEDEFATQVGNNIITAKVAGAGGDIPLDAPFQVFAYPGDPHHIIKVLGDGNIAFTGTAGGTLKARLADEFDNPISNRPLTFTVLEPGARPGMPRNDDGGVPGAAFINLTVFPMTPRCPVAVPLLGDCNGVGSLVVTTSVFGAGVDTILGNDSHRLLEGPLRIIYRVSASAEGVEPQTFSLYPEDVAPLIPFRVMTANLASLHLINDRGDPLNGTRVGTQFQLPLSVSLFLTEELYEVVESDQPCVEPGDICYVREQLHAVRTRKVDIGKPGEPVTFLEKDNREVQASKEQESASVTFTPIAGGGLMTPAVIDQPDQQAGGGIYSSHLVVGEEPAINTVEIDATAHVWAPYFDFHDGKVRPVPVSVKPGETVMVVLPDGSIVLAPFSDVIRYTQLVDVFGVRASVDERDVLVGPSGGTVKEFPLDYRIEPAEYDAQLAQIDLFSHDPAAAGESQDEWIGAVPGDVTSGEGSATLYQGTGFDPTKRYRMEVVLNRGTSAEIRGDPEELGAYLAGPFGADFRARRFTAEHARAPREIDLASELEQERATLQTVINEGLDNAAACGNVRDAGILILEQGSGACLWRAGFGVNPVGTCSAFHPGRSDHDFEVFIPAASAGMTDCLIEALSDAAIVDELGEVSFFPLPKEDLLNARLDVLPPSGGGADADGDLGLGRQTLLLGKFLLEGEYVTGLPGINVQAPSLESLLTKLREDPTIRIPGEATGIPRLEGYEQAALQKFAFYKSRSHNRMTGADITPKSQMFELAQRELRNAAKAAIRAAAGRLVADAAGNRLLFISRADYQTGGCVTGTEDPANPRPIDDLFPKACDTFEEHVASAAVRSVRQNLPIFTAAQVGQIFDFYRVKADPPCAAPGCQTQIVNERDANELVGSAIRFIEQMAQETLEVFLETVVNDEPARALQRGANLTRASDRADEVRPTVSRVLETRAFNANDFKAKRIPLRMDSDAAPSIVYEPLAIEPLSERVFDVLRDESGKPIRGDDGNVQPLFKPRLPALATHHVTMFLDPENKVRECDKRDNYAGFFTYPLNPDDATVPDFGERPDSPVPLPDPPPECADTPVPQLTLRKLVNGQAHIRVAPNTRVTLSHRVLNSGLVAVTNAMVADLYSKRSYGPFSLAPGEAYSFEDTHEVTGSGKEIVAPSEVLAFADQSIATTWDSVLIDVTTPLCDVRVLSYDPDPNPSTSEVMRGGVFFRYYKLVDKVGAPVANAVVTLKVNGIVFASTTNGDGEIVHVAAQDEDPRGLQIAADPIGGPGTYRGSFLSAGGTSSVCGPTFEVKVSEREFTRGWNAGAAIEAAATAAVGLQGKAGTGIGISIANDERADPPTRTLSLARSVNGELGVQAGISSPKAKGTLPFARLQLGAEVSATAAVTFMASDTHEFAYPPNSTDLGPDEATAFGGLLVATVASAGADNPVVARLLEAVIDEVTDFERFRTTDSASVGLKVSAAGEIAGIAALTPVGKGNPTEMKYGLGATFEAGGAASAVIQLDYKRIAKELVPGYTLAASFDISGALGFGSPSEETDDDTNEKILELNEKLKATLKGTIGGTWNAKLTLDENEGFKPSTLSISFASVKGFGYKAFGQTFVPVEGGSDPDKHTATYTIKDPVAIQETIDTLETLATLAGIGAGSLPPPLNNPALLGPALLVVEMIALFDILGRHDATYDNSTEFGDGVQFPIEIALGAGARVKLGASLSFDRSIGYATEKGTIKQGKSFALERYTRDANIPEPPPDGSDVAQLIALAADSVGQAGGTAIDVVSKAVEDGINFIRSRNTAELRFEGASLAAPAIALSSFTYQAMLGPVAHGAQRPADVSGRPDLPHYGIGGFHHFTPEDEGLTQPGTLTIFYDDDEAAGFDESSLGIYRWDGQSRDWDFVGGAVDTAANTITAAVTRLGMYTAGPAMPGGTFTFAAQPAPGGGITYASAVIRMNNGTVVPDGTMFTVQTLLPHATSSTALGAIQTPDEDPSTDGVQVTSANGVITFTATYPGNVGRARVLAFSTPGTALSDHIVP